MKVILAMFLVSITIMVSGCSSSPSIDAKKQIIDDATGQIAFFQQALAHPTQFQSVEGLNRAIEFQNNRIKTANQ